jgi:hypothetical protein
MEVIGEPKQVCLDRAKGFDGDKPRLALASPRGRLHQYKDISITPQSKTVAIRLAKNCIHYDTTAGPVARKRFPPVLE